MHADRFHCAVPAIPLLVIALFMIQESEQNGASSRIPRGSFSDPPARIDQELYELLSAYNIGTSHLDSVVDHTPINDVEQSLIYRLLYRLPRISAELINRCEITGARASDIARAPGAYRGSIYRFRGSAVHVETVASPVPIGEQYGYSEYYRTTVELEQDTTNVHVYSRLVPKAWTTADWTNLAERCEFQGLFFKVAENQHRGAQLVFIASRVKWHPVKVNASLNVTASHVYLSSLGMDIGLFDDVAQGKRMSATDADCFYELLTRLNKANAAELHRSAGGTLDIARALQDPAAETGRIHSVRGIARRALKIRVTDQDIRDHYGIDHYFQLDVFVPLDIPIELVNRSNTQESRVFNSYPVTICMARIPEQMEVGEQIREDIMIPACLLKLWAFQSNFSRQRHRDAGSENASNRRNVQKAPLLVGAHARILRSKVPTNPVLSLVFGAAFSLSIVVIALVLWRLNRRDAYMRRSTLSHRAGQTDKGRLGPPRDNARQPNRSDSDDPT